MSASQADATRMLCVTIHKDLLPASAGRVIMATASPAPQVSILESHGFFFWLDLIFSPAKSSQLLYSFNFGIHPWSLDSLRTDLVADSKTEKWETTHFHFLAPSPPIWTREVFGNVLLTRVDWCQLEPVSHFLLCSKEEFINALWGM